MRLSRDLASTYESTKDSLQRDLVTLQRAFDQSQQQLLAAQKAIAAIQLQLANPALSVAANGQVAGLPSSGLKTVAHDQSMFGQGTPTAPLRVSAAFVTALSPASPVSVYDHTFSVTDISGAFATPIVLVSGVANSLIMPFYWSCMFTKNNQSWGTGQSLQLMWTGSTKGTIVNDISPTWNTATVFSQVCKAGAISSGLRADSLAFAIGDPLKLTTSASLGAVGTFAFTAGLKVRILYNIITF